MVEQMDVIKAIGDVTLILNDIEGNIKEERYIPNLVVTVGREYIAARMATTPAIMSHMGVGSSTTAPAAGHTDLLSQLGTRAALDEAAVVSGNVVTYKSTFIPGNGTGAITEAGIFNALSSGTMLARTTFAVVNKTVDDSLTIIWNITIN